MKFVIGIRYVSKGMWARTNFDDCTGPKDASKRCMLRMVEGGYEKAKNNKKSAEIGMVIYRSKQLLECHYDLNQSSPPCWSLYKGREVFSMG